MLTTALKNMKVPQSPSKLMNYYSRQSNGFRPSYLEINRHINAGVKHIATLRKVLVLYGFIAYTGTEIYIDWYRVWQFSTLDSSKMGKKKDWSILPVTVPYWSEEAHQRMKPDEKAWTNAYLAIQTMLKDGVLFPEIAANNSELIKSGGDNIGKRLGPPVYHLKKSA